MASSIIDWQTDKDLASSNLYMLENEIMTDVEFVFPPQDDGKVEQILKAHKYMLVSRSPVFYTMFCGSFQEKGKGVLISDIVPEIFKELLRFLYTHDTTINAENVLHLLYAAKKYQVITLLNKCRTYLEGNINGDTVILILDQAMFYDEKELQGKCTNYLKENINHSYQSLKKHHVSPETLNMLVSDKEKICREPELFSYCLTWSEEECRRHNKAVNIENQRTELGPMLYKLHIPSMAINDFSSVVASSRLLSENDELQIYRYISGLPVTDMAFPRRGRLPYFNVTNDNNSYIGIVTECEWLLLGFTCSESTVSAISFDGRNVPLTPKLQALYFPDQFRVIFSIGCKRIALSVGQNKTVLHFNTVIHRRQAYVAVIETNEAINRHRWLEDEMGEEEVCKLNKLNELTGLTGFILRRRIPGPKKV